MKTYENKTEARSFLTIQAGSSFLVKAETPEEKR